MEALEQRSSWQKSDVRHAFCMKHLETFSRLRGQTAFACKVQTKEPPPLSVLGPDDNDSGWRPPPPGVKR